MTSSDDLIRDARAATGATSGVPKRKQAVVTCMDTRLDPLRMLNAAIGDLHVIRNAGGLVTDDVERSLVISQRRLRTTRIDVIMHTNCGMNGLDEAALRAEIVGAGAAPPSRFGSFANLDAELRRGVEQLRSNPALKNRTQIRGYVYDLGTFTLKLIVDS